MTDSQRVGTKHEPMALAYAGVSARSMSWFLAGFLIARIFLVFGAASLNSSDKIVDAPRRWIIPEDCLFS